MERLSRLQILIAYWGFGLHWGDFTIYSLFLLSIHHLMFSVLLIHLIVFAKQSSAYEVIWHAGNVVSQNAKAHIVGHVK